MKDSMRVKILVLGESSVGKSSLITQYTEQHFTPSHMPTIGVQYKQKLIELEDNSVLKVQIWDTAGTERFRTITPVYYRNVDGVLLVFNISDNQSFEPINFWVEELNDKADIASIELMLVGNKSDLGDSREVEKEKALELAGKIGIDYEQTSAKTLEGTEKAFNKLIQKILKKKKKQFGGGIPKHIKLAQPTTRKANDKKSSDCC